MQNKIKNKKISLKISLQESQEREKRAVADYQNLIRRQQQERLEIIKLSVSELIADLIQPLDHLFLAAAQINDQGLDMVISQLWEVLKDHGLEEINPESGDKFDLELMEAVESEQGGKRQVGTQHTASVQKLASKGYKLNNKVIRHAKVIVS
ncbi:MAG: nucleotide exchange factor GrpE [Patescibacteria group bacterium]